MLHIVTLNDGKNEVWNTGHLRELTNQLRLAEIDILCCQGMQRTLDGRQDPAREIAESLQMTSIFSATGGGVSTRGEGMATTISGLSILAGAYVWMLNSGSFPLPGEESAQKQVAQFAVIRQNEDWVLVINAEFSQVASIQLQQLRTVFTHQRLQERYGAVVLCSNRNLTISKRDLQSVVALSAYKLANEIEGNSPVTLPSRKQNSSEQSINKAILTLIARNQPPATIKIHVASAALLLESILSPEGTDQRASAENTNKFDYPLSYSEQWPGSRKQHDQVFDLSTS
jgi:hypothetical protein